MCLPCETTIGRREPAGCSTLHISITLSKCRTLSTFSDCVANLDGTCSFPGRGDAAMKAAPGCSSLDLTSEDLHVISLQRSVHE
jgi:hypothetical protein